MRYSRPCFREVSGNGIDFGLLAGPQGIVAFSRILSNREIVVAANASGSGSFPAQFSSTTASIEVAAR